MEAITDDKTVSLLWVNPAMSILHNFLVMSSMSYLILC